MKNYNVFYLEVVIWQEGLNIFVGELGKWSESTLKMVSQPEYLTFWHWCLIIGHLVFLHQETLIF